MKFRLFAFTVFAIGLSAFVLSLFISGPKDVTERNPDFAAATTAVNDANFDDVVLNSEKPVVLDFYGDYCPVCLQLESQLLPVADKYADTAVFARVDVQEAPELSQQYNVRAVPTLVMVHQGKLLFQSTGVSALAPLQMMLEEATE